MASPRSSNGGGAARWSGLIALPDFGSRVLSASAVVAYVALGAAAILSRSVMEASVGITLLKHEPSAQIPWANTMLGLVCVGMVSSSVACNHRMVTRRVRVSASIPQLATVPSQPDPDRWMPD